MMRKILVTFAIAGFAWALLPLVFEAGVVDAPGKTASSYIENSPKDFAAANIVTAIVVSYRGFDTLGEVAVLFAATAGVGSLLTKKRLGIVSPQAGKKPSTEVLRTANGLLSSLLVIFGAYIFIHGHLTPGGGFQGGVVIATGVPKPPGPRAGRRSRTR